MKWRSFLGLSAFLIINGTLTVFAAADRSVRNPSFTAIITKMLTGRDVTTLTARILDGREPGNENVVCFEEGVEDFSFSATPQSRTSENGELINIAAQRLAVEILAGEDRFDCLAELPGDDRGS